MHKFMAKNYKKSFENERKIERRFLLAERERKNFEKLSARDGQNYPSERWAQASKFSERTKALTIALLIRMEP